MQRIHVQRLAEWLERAGAEGSGTPRPLLLDVREAWEVALCSLPGSVHIPMGQVPARLDEIDPEAPVVCVCHHGVRSARVAWILERSGFGRVFNLEGGIDAWARQVDPACATY